MLFFIIVFWVIITGNCNDNNYLKQYYHGTPAPQDECKNIKDYERYPGDCPATVGPPCPNCYINEASDYEDGNTLTFTDNEREIISERMQWYLDWWVNGKYNPTKDLGYDVFRGSAGRAYIFLKVYMQSKHKDETLLTIANKYINNALDLLPPDNKQKYCAFMKGHIGVWTMKVMYEKIKKRSSESNKYMKKIIETFYSVDYAILNKEEISSVGINVVNDCTLDSGLPGMILNALLLNNYFQEEIIDIFYVKHIIYHCLDIGIETGKSLNTNYLQFYFPSFDDISGNCTLFGPGHGSSGFIKHVYNTYNMYPEILKDLFDTSSKYYIALKNTLDFYLSIQLDDNNIPTNINGGCSIYGQNNLTDDARVQWCHGSPAFQNIFLESSILFQDINSTAADMYFVSGVESMDVTWERGLLTKGPQFCHGIGGNLMMFWESADFFKKLGEQHLANKAMWRAKQFLLWTLDWNNLNKTRMFVNVSQDDWDERHYSMFQGSFSMPIIYVDFIEKEWPWDQTVCMPNWNACFGDLSNDVKNEYTLITSLKNIWRWMNNY